MCPAGAGLRSGPGGGGGARSESAGGRPRPVAAPTGRGGGHHRGTRGGGGPAQRALPGRRPVAAAVCPAQGGADPGRADRHRVRPLEVDHQPHAAEAGALAAPTPRRGPRGDRHRPRRRSSATALAPHAAPVRPSGAGHPPAAPVHEPTRELGAPLGAGPRPHRRRIAVPAPAARARRGRGPGGPSFRRRRSVSSRPSRPSAREGWRASWSRAAPRCWAPSSRRGSWTRWRCSAPRSCWAAGARARPSAAPTRQLSATRSDSGRSAPSRSFRGRGLHRFELWAPGGHAGNH